MNFVLKKQDEKKVNPFCDCEIFDVTLTDRDEIYDALVKINAIFINLPKAAQNKPIYLNFDYANKCVIPSFEKTYLACLRPINFVLGFKWDPELEDVCGEDEDEATYNALSPAVDEIISLAKDKSLQDSDLPWLDAAFMQL